MSTVKSLNILSFTGVLTRYSVHALLNLLNELREKR